MKYIKRGKVYNTENAVEAVFITIGQTDEAWMFYKTPKGHFFSVYSDEDGVENGEFRTHTEIEVMDEYLNYLERNGMAYDKEDEINDVLPNLEKYIEDLEEM